MSKLQPKHAPTNEEVITLLRNKLKNIEPNSTLNFENHATIQIRDKVAFTAKRKKEQGVIKLISLKKEENFKVCFEFFRKMYEEYANAFGKQRVKYKRFWFLTKDDEKPYFKIHFGKVGEPIEEKNDDEKKKAKKIKLMSKEQEKKLKLLQYWKEKKEWDENKKTKRVELKKERDDLINYILGLSLNDPKYGKTKLKKLIKSEIRLDVDEPLRFGVINKLLVKVIPEDTNREEGDEEAKEEQSAEGNFRKKVGDVIRHHNDFITKQIKYVKKGRPLRTNEKDMFRFEFWPSKYVKIVGYVQKCLYGAGLTLDSKAVLVSSPDK